MKRLFSKFFVITALLLLVQPSTFGEIVNLTTDKGKNISIEVLPGRTVCKGTRVTLSNADQTVYPPDEQLTLYLENPEGDVFGIGSNRYFPVSFNADLNYHQIHSTVPVVLPITVLTRGASYGTAYLTIQITTPVAVPEIVSATGSFEVCQGNSIKLLAQGDGYRKWSTGKEGPKGSDADSIVVTPSTNTTYTLTVMDTNDPLSCSNSAQKEVTVIPPRSEQIEGPTAVCDGEDFSLKAPEGVAYRWKEDGLDSQISRVLTPVVKPSVGTHTYSVIVRTAQGCEQEFSHIVTVKNKPDALILGESTINEGQSTELVAFIEGGTYQWGTNSAVPISNPTSRIITVSPTMTADYWVDVTVNGCTQRAQKTINVRATSNVQVTSDKNNVCKGEPVVLTATGADTYEWEDGTTNRERTVHPQSTTTYIVSGKLAGGTPTTKTITIYVSEPENGQITGANQVCAGDSVELVAPAGSNWVWQPTGKTTQHIWVKPTIATNYTVTLKGTNGCEYTTAQHFVQVNPKPSTVIIGKRTACQGEEITLTAPEGVEWVWSTHDVTREITVRPNATTTYTVTTKSANGCISEASVEVVVTPRPTVHITSSNPNQTICAGETVTLTASGATNFRWATGEVTASIPVSPSATTTYKVFGNNGPGCEVEAEITINVNQPENGTIEGKLSACEGETIKLTAPSGTNYLWNTGATTREINVPITATTDFSVQLDGLNGCRYTTAVHRVTVNAVPSGNITGDLTICRGEETELTAPDGNSWIWEPDFQTTKTIKVKPNQNTTYRVTVFNADGCEYTTQAEVQVSEKSQITISPASAIVCKNEPLTLSASGADNYIWVSDNQYETEYYGSEINIIPTVTTTYTVFGTNGAGCESTKTITVTVKEPENKAITGAAAMCAGDSVLLTAPEGSNWQWNTGETTRTIWAKPTIITTYSVTLNGLNGCQYTTAGHEVTVRQAPVGAIAGPTKVCRGNEFTLTAPEGTSYVWSNGKTTRDITITNPQFTETYKVTVTNQHDCSKEFSKEVQIVSLPIIELTADNQTICIGDQVTITATGAESWIWDYDGSTNSTLTIEPTISNTYTVQGFNADGCQATGTITINVIQPENGTIIGKTSVCEGKSITLTAPMGSDWEWSTGETDRVISVSPNAPTAYSVKLIGTNGCPYTTALHEVDIVPVPTGQIVANKQTICRGEQVELTAPAGDSYSWDNGKTDQHIVEQIMNTTTFRCTVTNSQGCSTTFSKEIEVVALPTITLTANKTTICQGDAVTITAAADGVNIWEWEGLSDNGNSITVNPTQTTTYTVIGTNVYDCSSSKSITINVSEPENGTIIGETSVCEGEAITLTAPVGSNYLWNNGEKTASITVTPQTSPATYFVTLDGTNGCRYTTAHHVVTIAPKPAGTILGNKTICRGESTELTAPAGVSYLWDNGATTPSITVTPTAVSTTYKVVVTNDLGCEKEFSAVVNLNEMPTTTITPSARSICKGGSVELVATGAANYTWTSDDPNFTTVYGSKINVSPTVTTTYTVVGATVGGCTVSVSETITVLEAENGVITGKNSVCEGESIVLMAPEGSNWLWNNGKTEQSITVSPDETFHTYRVTLDGTNGCRYTTADHTVSIDSKPTGDISGDRNICKGSNTTLKAPVGVSYKWNTGEIGQTITVSPQDDTEYSVVVTNNSGCSQTFTAQVTVNQPQIKLEANNQTICNGEMVTITASGAETWLWAHDNSTLAQITESPTSTTIYTVTGTDANGCKAQASITITVKQLETGTITGPTAGCLNEQFTLVAPAGSNYVWSTGETTPTIAVTPTSAGNKTYYVTLTGTNGCRYTTANHVVNVHSLPVGSISGDLAVCKGKTTTLTAPTGASYLWSNNATTPSITVEVNNPATYEVTVTNANGCSQKFTTQVTPYPLPTLSLKANNQTICLGEQVTITATGATTWLWNNGKTEAVITESPTATTTYSVKGIDANGCEAEADITITVKQPENGVITGENFVCEGEPITLTAPAGSNYKWSTGETTPSINVSPTSDASYNVTLDGTNGCRYTTANFNVMVNEKPTGMIVGNQTICRGGSTELTAPAGTSWLWTHNGSHEQTITVSPTSNTTYEVEVANNLGCTKKFSINIVVNQPPTITLKANNQTICLGEQVTITATGAATWLWNNGKNSAEIIESPTETTTYTVIGTDVNGCEATTDITITVKNPENGVISGKTSVCEGESVTLTAPVGSNYKWSNNSTQSTITVPITADETTFFVTLDGTNGCRYTTANHVVKRHLKPSGTITGNKTICRGSSTTLKAPDGVSWIWNNNATTQEIEVSPLNTATYDVIVTGEGGCTSAFNTKVIVNQPPTLSLKADNQTICLGESVTITATGAVNWAWEHGKNGAVITESPTDNTTYKVVGTDVNGCSSEAEITIAVLMPETGVITGPSVVCEGSEITLIAPAGSNYKWSSGEEEQTITVHPSSSTVYNVTLDGTNGCRYKTADHAVSVHPLPANIITGVTTICLGETTTLTAPDGVSWVWSNGATINSIEVDPSVNTTYSVITTLATGCTMESSVEVIVNQPPAITLKANNQTVCRGEQVTITASGAVTWIWNNGKVGSTITETPLETTTYTVVGTSAQGCENTEQITITVLQPENKKIQGPTVVCSGVPTDFTAPDGSDWVWSNGSREKVIHPILTQPTTLTVTLKGVNGCTYTTVEHNVAVNPKPTGIITGNKTICQGESTELTAPNGNSWLWDNGSEERIRIVSPMETTTYRVTTTNNLGCSLESQVEVVVNKLPTVTISATKEKLCKGESVTFTAVGAETYDWSNGLGNSAKITVTPSETTTYTVVGTSLNGCSATATITIPVYDYPEITITGETHICTGGTTTLTASAPGNVDYFWAETGDHTPSIIVSPTQSPTQYTVIVTDRNSGCSTNKSIEVFLNEKPTPLINGKSNGTTKICAGTSYTLTANAGTGSYTYVWNTGETGEQIIVTPDAETTVYEVTAIGSNNCQGSTKHTIRLNPLPIARIQGPTTACVGTSVRLVATGGGTYEWEDGTLGDEHYVTPTETTTYKVTVTSPDGCKSEVSHTINTIPRPQAKVQGVLRVCPNSPTTLTVEGGSSYRWNNGTTESSITVSPAVQTTYSVTVYNELNQMGCDTTIYVTVQVHDVPVPEINNFDNFTICQGSSTTLSVSAPNVISYLWSTGEEESSIEVEPNSSTSYWCLVTYANGCTAKTERNIVVNPRPSLQLEGETDICLGDVLNLTAKTVENGLYYVWSTGEEGTDLKTITPKPTSNGTYWCEVTNANGCVSKRATFNVRVHPVPTDVRVDGADLICEGSEVALTAVGGNRYEWITGETTPTINVTAPGTYWVKIYNEHDCFKQIQHHVQLAPTPTATINATKTQICPGEEVVLTAAGGTKFQWNTGSTQNPLIVNPTETTTYKVTVWNTQGCSAEAEIKILVNEFTQVTGDTIICKGNPATLTASGCESYLWSTGATEPSITVFPEDTKTYYVDGTAYGCTSRKHITVVVYKPFETAKIESADAVCVGKPITLHAVAEGGNLTYEWQPGGSTDPSLTYTPSELEVGEMTFYCTLTNVGGCSTLVQKTIRVNPLPTPVISSIPDGVICAKTPVQLVLNGIDEDTNILWEETGETTPTITISNPLQTTVYHATVRNANGCENRAEFTLNVQPLPTPKIEGQGAICKDDPIRLEATGLAPGIEYEYEWQSEPYLGENVGPVLLIEHLNTTTLFRLVVRTPDGCENYATKQVVVEPKPEVLIEGDTWACANSKVTLTARSETAVSYLWSTGETTQTIQPKITETKDFWVKVTNAMGCESVACEHTVYMEPPFVAEIKVLEMKDRMCKGETLELRATHTSTSPVNYLWSTGETTQSIQVSPESTTTYTVTITNENGCKAADTKQITVDVVPKPQINAPADVCQGTSVHLEGSNLSVGTPYSSYQWSTASGETYFGKEIDVPNLEETTKFTLVVTNENGCEASTTHTINVRQTPKVEINGPEKVCTGSVAKLEATADMPATFKWSNGKTTSAIFLTVTKDTVVSVVATNLQGCESEPKFFTVKVEPQFTAEIVAPQTTICRGSEVTLTVSCGVANPTYLWQTGETGKSITVRPEVSTTYSVTVTNEFGCIAEASIEIKIDDIATPKIEGPAVICEGDQLTLTAPEGYDYYLWDDGTTNRIRTINNPLETAVYSLTVTNSSGCTASASTAVTVAPKPTVAINGPNVGCAGKPVTLKANSPTAVRYLWSTGETTQTISPIMTSDSIFTVKVWNSADCESNEASLSIHIEPNPVASIEGRDTICVGETIKLTAQGGASYQWSVEGQVNSEIWVSPLVTTTYSVIVSNLYGCTNEVSHTVVVEQLPKPEIHGRTSMCVGDSILLTASDGTNALTTFVWNTGQQGKTIWVKPTTSKNYYVTAKNRFGCSTTSAPHIVTVYQVPQPTIMGDTKVCFGESATFTASGGTSYRWSTGQITPTIEIPAYMLSPIGKHNFYVDVSNAGGCVTRKDFTVETVSLPNPIINVKDGTTNLCAGDQVTLEVTGVSDARKFLWSNGSTEESITVKPTTKTTYSVTVENSNGCEKTVSITIFVAPKPDISIVSSANPISLDVSGVCNEQEVVLTAIGGSASDTYEWAFDGQTEIGPQIFVHPTHSTVYSLKVTNLAGCEVIKTHQVLVEEPLNPTINGFYNSSGVEKICYGQSIKLVATGGVEYHWEGIELNSPEVVVTPQNTTTYYLTVKTQAGCVATISHRVEVESLPRGKVDGPNQICQGEEIELTATGGVSYRWSTNETTDKIRVKPTETTIYSVEIIGHNGCSVVKEHMVKVAQAPQGKVEGNTTICGSGEYAVLTASGGSAYKWSTGATTPTISVRPSITATYWVDVFNAEGCNSRVEVEVVVGQRPMPTITCTGGKSLSDTSSEICEGDVVMLTGHGAGDDGVYHWRSTDNNFDEVAQSVNVSPTLTTTYYAESVTQDGCSAVASYTVHVLPMTKIIITPTRDKVCPGESVILRAEGSSGYTWELPDGSQKTGNVIEVAPTRTSTYTVRTLNANGCTNKASITIEVVPLPVPTIYGNTAVCLGSSTTLTATGGVSYRWSSGEITESIEITPLQDTEYEVTAMNELGCESKATIQVTVLPTPEPIITGNTAIYKGESTTLTASGGAAYKWSTGETTASIVVTPLETTTYEVIAINGTGCQASIPITVVVSDFNASVTGETSICMGQSTTLTSNGGEGATYIWNTGATTPSITVSPVETTTYSVAVYTAFGSTGTGSITVTVNALPKIELSEPSAICQGDGMVSIPYVAREGSPTQYSLTFDEFGVTQGFQNIQLAALPQGSIDISVPNGAAPGTYKATFVAENAAGCGGIAQEITLQIRRKDMIIQKWDDVLVCDNSNHAYVAYQWYKNGNPATGANLQYYSETGGFNGEYHVVAKRADGSVDVSCPKVFVTRRSTVKLSPNPIERNKTLKLELPYSDLELFGAEMVIYDAAGKRLATYDRVFAENDIQIPFNAGVYIVRVRLANGEVVNEKFIVIK